MEIKIGTLKKDVTAFGNKYWIQVEDQKTDNSDLENLVDKKISVVIGDITAIDDFIQEVETL